jgi:hypothetical protein
MGIKNTQKMRDAGCDMAVYLLYLGLGPNGEIKNQQAVAKAKNWQKERDAYELLVTTRRDKKRRKKEAKRIAKLRGENQGK